MRSLAPVLVFLSGLVLAPSVHAEADCEMSFSLKGWSAFYKTASGTGTIRCTNGQTARVKIKTKGGGITFGKSSITDGRGEFSGVSNISEVFGTYVEGGAHAGAAKSAKAAVMTKGDVNLAIAGKGKGWDLGVAFGKFVITRQ